MSANAQIQLHFPAPGEWDNFLMTSLWEDADGYDCRRSYAPEDIPAGQLPTLQAVVDALVGLDEPWQATHVVACLSDDGSAVELILNVRRADGAQRSFTSAEYPQLRLEDAAVIDFFTCMSSEET